MPDYTIESRTYVGQLGTIATSGWQGFVIGEQYELSYELTVDKRIAIQLNHLSLVLGRAPLIVSRAQFNRWWKRLSY